MRKIYNFFSGRFGKRVLIDPYRLWWKRFWCCNLFIVGMFFMGILLQFLTSMSKFFNYVIWGI